MIDASKIIEEGSQDLLGLLFCFDNLIHCLLEMFDGCISGVNRGRVRANDSHLIIGNDGTIGKDLITSDK